MTELTLSLVNAQGAVLAAAAGPGGGGHPGPADIAKNTGSLREPVFL